MMRQVEFQEHWYQVLETVKQEPVKDRKCTDVGWAAVFCIMVAAFFGIGVYQIAQNNSMEQLKTQQNIVTISQNIPLQKHANILIVSICTSLLSSCLYTLLFLQFPKTMVYTTMFLTLIIFAICQFASIYTQNIPMSIIMGILLSVYAFIIICYHRSISKGAVLTDAASDFVKDNKVALCVCVGVHVGVALVVGYLFGFSFNVLVGVISQKGSRLQSRGQWIVLLVLWVYVLFVFTFLLYYMMTYTISVLYSYWFYQMDQPCYGILSAYKCMFLQIGSLTFTAFLLPLVKITSIFFTCKRRIRQPACTFCLGCCTSMVSCCFKSAQQYLPVLNTTTTVLQSLTAQPYLQSAKTSVGLFCHSLQYLSKSTIFSNLMLFWGYMIPVAIPCAIAYLRIYSEQSQFSEQQKIVVFVYVVICSALVSNVVLQVVVDSVGCVCVYFVIDGWMVSRGIRSKAQAEVSFQEIRQYLQQSGKQNNRNTTNQRLI